MDNFVGQFQDLDPKGYGVIKAEVPAALESACQLLNTYLQPDRKFHMMISSKAKVYPIRDMMEECNLDEHSVFMTPIYTDVITLK